MERLGAFVVPAGLLGSAVASYIMTTSANAMTLRRTPT
jgi:hypothetical protein